MKKLVYSLLILALYNPCKAQETEKAEPCSFGKMMKDNKRSCYWSLSMQGPAQIAPVTNTIEVPDDRPINQFKLSGLPMKKVTNPLNPESITYKDETISIAFSFCFPGGKGAGTAGIGPNALALTLKNLTSAPIDIVWEEATVTDLKGNKKKLVLTRNWKAYTQTLPVGEDSLLTGITTDDCISRYHHAAHYDENGNWVEAWNQIEDYKLFCPSEVVWSSQNNNMCVSDVKRSLTGKQFTLSIPLLINNNKVVKAFVFKVDDIVCTK